MRHAGRSILLALALCLTLLPAAAWAEETGTNGDETCTHADWKYIDDEEGQRHIQQCKNCPKKITPTDCIHREGTTKGKCEICGLDLAVSLNDWTGGRCVTTWEKAFSHVGSSKYYPITDITENVTLNNANGEPLKIHMAGYKATGKLPYSPALWNCILILQKIEICLHQLSPRSRSTAAP